MTKQAMGLYSLWRSSARGCIGIAEELGHGARRPGEGFGVLCCLAALAALLLCLAPTVSADEGWASWYGPGFQGNYMANGQIFNQYDSTTTASNTYSLGRWLRVTNSANGRSVDVQVRDRGGFAQSLDLSRAAFASIADLGGGPIHVRIDPVAGPGAQLAASGHATTSSRSGRAADSAKAGSTHIVEAGETLWNIATDSGVDLSRIEQANDLSDDSVLQVGQAITIPGRAASSAGASAGNPRAYTIQAGDTLYDIAHANDVDLAALEDANGLNNDSLIQPGDTLRLP